MPAKSEKRKADPQVLDSLEFFEGVLDIHVARSREGFGTWESGLRLSHLAALDRW